MPAHTPGQVNFLSLQPVQCPLPIGLLARQGVDPVILGMPAMAFDPAPFDPVALGGRDQLLPQLRILDRLLVRRAPAIALPVVNPARDPIADILAVGMKLDAARPFQGLERLDRRHQLHAVVGRERLAARDLPLLFTHAQECRPAARARVPAAGAVGEYLDERKLAQATSSRGSLKVMRSGVWSATSSVTSNRARRASRTSRTSTSGADAPAVTPIVAGRPSQSQSISPARSIRRAGTPMRSATSARRSELLLLGAPMTSNRSHSGTIALTAACRFDVA